MTFRGTPFFLVFPYFILLQAVVLVRADEAPLGAVTFGVRRFAPDNILRSQDGASQILRSAILARLDDNMGEVQVNRSEPGRMTVSVAKDIICSDGEVLSAGDLAASLEHCGKVNGVNVLVSESLPLNMAKESTQTRVEIKGEVADRTLGDCPLFRKWFAERAGDEFGKPAMVVGCGPYRLSEYVPGERATLDAYQGTRAPIARITLKRLKEGEDGLNYLRHGRIDAIVDPLPEERERVLTDPTLISLDCKGFTIATRRIMNIECEDGFRISRLRWLTGEKLPG